MTKLLSSPLMSNSSRLLLLVVVIVLFRGFRRGGWSQLFAHSFAPRHTHTFATARVILGLFVLLGIIVIVRGRIVIGESFLYVGLCVIRGMAKEKRKIRAWLGTSSFH